MFPGGWWLLYIGILWMCLPYQLLIKTKQKIEKENK